jgi:hypothetical protein
MCSLGKDLGFVTQYIRNLRGGSQPILVQASDRQHYVVKFSNNLQGPNLLFNESIGSELYRACGLAVPAWRPLEVSEDFLDRNPDCWMQTPKGRLRPASGLCFGSRFLGSEGVRLLEILPKASYRRIRNQTSFWLAWLIDICAEHVDNRQAVFVEDAAGWLDAFFVDHGHLFGGPKAGTQKHFQASRYLDPRIYQSVSSEHLLDFQRVALGLDADQLWQQIRELPDEWKTASALEAFERSLNRLSNAKLLQHILETLADSIQRINERECDDSQDERKSQIAILQPRIQAAGLEHRLSANRFGHSACAYERGR